MANITSTDPLVVGSVNADEIHTDSINGSASTVIGGLGNDVYFIDAFYENGVIDTPADLVQEAFNEGIDIVKLDLFVGAGLGNLNPFFLFENVENLELNLSTTDPLQTFSLTGNSLANKISVLSASAGANASIRGGAGNDTLIGGAGNDTLNGGTDADSMVGGLGNDTYVVDSLLDKVTEAANAFTGGGDDLVQSTVNFSLGANIENLTLIGADNINGTGNALNNIMIGNNGNNGNNIINGGAGNDNLNGGNGSDTLIGGLGNDTLTGGTGSNRLDGGAGDDLYNISSATDIITDTGGGIDRVSTSVQLLGDLSAGIENLDLNTGVITGRGNALNNIINGNGANNVLFGLAGNDTLNGGLGDDNMIGGLGNDTYIVDSTADVVTEDSVTGGIDTVFSVVDYTLGLHVENLTLIGAGVISGTGNALANIITGNISNNSLSGGDGNDSLNGGAGADTMFGGIGNDTYYVDNVLDVVDETGGTGLDSVIASVTFDMSSQSVDNVENLILAGTSNISGTGNSFANTITGNIGNNSLSGGLGNDTLIGGLGNDTLNGGAGFDSLVGGEGSDSLTGGVGIDTLIGGLGSDIYIIDDAGDIIVEGVNAGIDGLRFNIAGALSLTGQLANIEQAILTDEIVVGLKVGGTNIIGNNLNNLLIGNTGNNILDGGVGNDTLNGDAGNDSLVGGAGNDTLDGGAENDTLNGGAGNDSLTGGAGIDSLVGGLGNDIYVIDTADIITGVASDIIVEGVNAGIDGLRFNIAGALSLTGQLANIEQAILTDGFGGTNISGNNLNNLLLGNAGNNSVDGGAGNDTLYGEGGTGAGNDTLIGGTGLDTMIGGLGNDTYYVDNIGDRVFENFNSGVDSVFSTVNFNLAVNGINIENTQLDGSANTTATGNALNNQLSGLGSGNNKLLGGAGNDTLIAGAGSDTLTGGTGNDVFSIGQVSTGFLATALDAITDFTVSQDKLQLLSFVGLTFTGVGSSLTASQFHLGTAAVDADDFIIYNQATGNLYYDADGNGAGAQVQIFDFTGTLPFLSSTDIFG